MPNCHICGAWTKLTFTVHPDRDGRLCPTCMRFAPAGRRQGIFGLVGDVHRVGAGHA